jgi:hypothetical protein
MVTKVVLDERLTILSGKLTRRDGEPAPTDLLDVVTSPELFPADVRGLCCGTLGVGRDPVQAYAHALAAHSHTARAAARRLPLSRAESPKPTCWERFRPATTYVGGACGSGCAGNLANPAF